MSKLKEPYNLSPRVKWLRDYYFKGVERNWNNEALTFTTGTEHDDIYDEFTFYIVPEVHNFFNTFVKGCVIGATKIDVPDDFYKKSIAERKQYFIQKAIVDYVPQEILPGDLIAGARFNMSVSRCHTPKEAKEYKQLLRGKNGFRKRLFEMKDRGIGNCGPTSGHLIPDYATAIIDGFKAKQEYFKSLYNNLSEEDKQGKRGGNLRAMIASCETPKLLAEKYAKECLRLAEQEKNEGRKAELLKMHEINKKVPWLPAEDFYEAMQSLWMTHMLVMTDENYPGPGVSFGRLDQYLYPYYKKSIENGEDKEFLKEIIKCFFIHCNTAYDSMIRTGTNQGITAGYGQLFNISGCGKDGVDMTNDLTYLLLEVIDEMSPLLEPKPNVRLHQKSPEKLLDIVADMISASQGAPFLLNFDERSMAGMLLQAKRSGMERYINLDNVHEYASVGCLENTMCGNDRSATVDCNLNIMKALEYALNDGRDLIDYKDMLWGKKITQTDTPPRTGDPREFSNFEEFFAAFSTQLKYIVKQMADFYSEMDAVRAKFSPTPYLSSIVKGCAENGKDITEGGAELNYVTIEAVTYASTVDSLLAVKYLVYDKKICAMDELIKALKANWEGYEKLQAAAINKAPKYGRDDDTADELARRVMEIWSDECWNHKTETGKQYRGGMLSWNYWISSGYILPASPDGRKKGQFLSNAICPVNGADINGPTSNSNSVGKALGGKGKNGDYLDYYNYLPNGASHTITLNPSLVKDKENREKLKAFIKGYVKNGGTALQVNVLDPEMLKDAQKNPQNYRHLLVRITGYNAYFTSIGKELQDEIIARESHRCM